MRRPCAIINWQKAAGLIIGAQVDGGEDVWVGLYAVGVNLFLVWFLVFIRINNKLTTVAQYEGDNSPGSGEFSTVNLPSNRSIHVCLN